MFWQQVVNGLTAGATYALVAAGYTLVFGVLEIINMAHAEIFMIGAFIGLLLVTGTCCPVWAAVAGAMIGAGLLGWALERLALRPLRKQGVSHLAPLISTIGVSIFLMSLAMKIFGPQSVRFPASVEPRFFNLFGTVNISLLQIVILGISLALVAALKVLLARTRLGKALRAVAENPEAAGLMGVNVNSVMAAAVVMASALGGAAGVLVGLQFNAVSPTMGIAYGLKGLAIIIVGGMGSVAGAVAGGLLLGAAEVLAIAYIGSSYRDAVAFIILIAVLLIKPSGIFGKLEGRKG
ncbi:branched-chain amino acid ABC-type transport system, permease components [Pelotomaculum thermopropionicum SI]|uniref:Branched-chain amino acid ABC-type transport system, permease components n=1 Tax=Pelotomaculum thermopropionicum (strain DSM 13744 / JCM 10971 / SI) TaxID=370438 RepID=A5CZP0_PELTS|nr:branched-chain amino acid ABC-type transport system, permease components [Pelotomaculum thermopropionicum SI]